jgi:large subunit ribosomal protein L15
LQLHDLKASPSARKEGKRVGRGIGSGLGKTSGRGQKGQGSRSGKSKGAYFEGGQLPLVRRVPKRGFNNARFSKDYAVVNVSDLNRFESGSTVSPEEFKNAGFVGGNELVKVLGTGDISVALTVRAHAFSKTAQEKIEAAGGKAEVI